MTAWSRDNARRRLAAAVRAKPGRGQQVASRSRKPRGPKYLARILAKLGLRDRVQIVIHAHAYEHGLI